MTEAHHFDALTSPIEGTNLIEASAGTGKTYTITCLFLRLLIERGLGVNEILVVSFTEAATQELKARIRRRINLSIRAFDEGGSTDPFLEGLVQLHRGSNTAKKRLETALGDFDQASIYTIHGFCARILYENAFESGALFDTRLVADITGLNKEVVEDFWRNHLYRATPLFANYLLTHGFRPKTLYRLASLGFNRPYIHIIPDPGTPDPSPQERNFRQAFEEVRHGWAEARPRIVDILLNSKALNRTKYRQKRVSALIEEMDRLVASKGHNPQLFKGFEKFTSDEINKGIKSGYSSLTDPFFDLCRRLKQRQEELADAYSRKLLGLKAELFRFVKTQLELRKGRENIQSFDDLLLKVKEALQGKGGESLAKTVSNSYGAALVDEFQDTDPIQYSIFKEIFSRHRGVLFLIGDPKQAIYGFRGGDVFTYTKAAGDVDKRYTLGDNWRSEPGLVASVNTLFSTVDHPFLYEGIPFRPVVSGNDTFPESLKIDGKRVPPMRLWFLEAQRATQPARAITKETAEKALPASVASEVAQLLSKARENRALVGERPLKEADIAVLVRRNREARLIQKALWAARVPSVIYSAEDLFVSSEALEMKRLLAGIAEPDNETAVRAALSTDLLGIKGEDLEVILGNEAEWENYSAGFRNYHELWSNKGFIRMFRELLRRQEVLPRLMSFPDGERRSTNVLHLSEVLQSACVEKNLGMKGLLKWLSEQRNPSTQKLEEHQLRLESDENAVRVITVHKSKGLEFPVVFCPFLWDGSKIRDDEPIIFHNEGEEGRLILDLGSDDLRAHKAQAEREQLSENLRLLYVALSRARNLCYFVWGPFSQAETSAPAYLLHQPPLKKDGDVLSETEERFRDLGDEDLIRDLEQIEERSEGTIRIEAMPLTKAEPLTLEQPEEESLKARAFSGPIPPNLSISSFSALTSDRHHGTEITDRDSQEYLEGREADEIPLSSLDPKGEQEEASLYSFPGGAQAGIFFHQLLEELDFTGKGRRALWEVVAAKLAEFGFEPHWHGLICRKIESLINTPLFKGRYDLKLSAVKGENRINEMEFYFPIKAVSPEKIQSLFSGHSPWISPPNLPASIGRLKFPQAAGYMKGFIDLVFYFDHRFYLVDWKSNILGGQIADYSQDRLFSSMKENLYFLQYYIYTLALDRYLSTRIRGYSYENDFGGVFYIFLRGVSPETGPDYGVYWDLPSHDLIRALGEELLEGPL